MMVAMKKKLTLLIFDATGKPVKQTTIPRMLLPMTFILFMGIAIALYLGISDYLRMKNEVKDVHSLRSALQMQEERVVQQQIKLSLLLKKIDALKAQNWPNLKTLNKKSESLPILKPTMMDRACLAWADLIRKTWTPTMIEQDYQESCQRHAR
jgi:hypothetical protein